jgi:hypothetical protein
MPLPAGAVGASADAFAVPRGMAQVAGEYLAQATCVDDLHYNGVSILVLQQASQVILGQWNHVIQTFPPKRAQQSLTQCVRLRTLRGRFQDLQPQVTYALVEVP